MKTDRLGGPRLYEPAPEPSHVRARFELDDGEDAALHRRAALRAGGRSSTRAISSMSSSPPASGSSRSPASSPPSGCSSWPRDRTAPLKSFLLTQIAGGRDREHLRRRGALAGPAASALTRRLDEARARRAPGGGDRRRRWRPGSTTAGRASTTTSTPAASAARCRTSSSSTRVRASCLPASGATGEIMRIVVTGRSTYFCPVCQERLRRRPRRKAKRRRAGEGEVTEPPPLPRGVRGRALVGSRRAGPAARVVIPPPETPGGVCVHGGGPGTRETDTLRPLANAPGGERHPAHRRQRLRAGGGRRRRPLARGARARLLHARSAGCRWSRAAVIYDLPVGRGQGPARGRRRGTRPARPRAAGCRSAGPSGPGPGRRSARCSGASARLAGAASATRRIGHGRRATRSPRSRR